METALQPEPSLSLHVRDNRLSIPLDESEQWLRRDPVSYAFFCGLSTTFPDGERFFAHSVRFLARLAGNDLKASIACFLKQEAHHSREHAKFNKSLAPLGIPVDQLAERCKARIEDARKRDPITQLAITVALEHITSAFAAEILKNPAYLRFAGKETRALWRWHAVEELEHRAVASDLFLAATSDWGPFKRWRIRSWAFFYAAKNLVNVLDGNIKDICSCSMFQGRSWRLRMIAFLLFHPGLLNAIAPNLLLYFWPGFQPSGTTSAAAEMQHTSTS